MSQVPNTIDVVDSHTEGEPTRVVVSGWPQPAGATMAERCAELIREQSALRRAVVCEPRGHDAVVGALLTPPVEQDSTAGVIFFNNVGALGMCGHGLIGVARTLSFLGRLDGDTARIDTPVGTVGFAIEADGSITISNVASRCHSRDVAVDVPGLGRVTGDVAWGGNWFFLTQISSPAISFDYRRELLSASVAIKRALDEARITGEGGAEIDHVELFGPASRDDADSRNFVLCPGLEYDRSPCGTGTSAKIAVLAARGKLDPGERWRQESITGSLFTGWYERRGDELFPFISGRAFVTARSSLVFEPGDPFLDGIGGR
ncbi:MAG: proline racemase family protein [Acidobacteria bacterium]|nr:proline racemase family protein [Acidobacteriota bacterium]